MHHLWETLKQHPWLYGGLALGAIVLYFGVFGGGGSASGSGGNSGTQADTQAAEQLQAAQLAVSAQNHQTDAALQANAQQVGGQIALAQIGAQQAGDANQLAAGVASQYINAQQKVAITGDTLQANVQNNAINQSAAVAEVQSNNQTAQIANVVNGLTQLGTAQTQAAVQMSGINAWAASQNSGGFHLF